MPRLQTIYPPMVQIKINSRIISEQDELDLISISVDQTIQIPSMFTLELAGMGEDGSFLPWLERNSPFAIADEVEIQLRYPDTSFSTLIQAEITGFEPEFVWNRTPSLMIRGYDRRHRLQRGKQTRTFLNQKDSAIVTQIATEAGLAANVTDTEVEHEYVLQANQTDLEFLQERAKQIHYEMLVEHKTLIFRPVANAAPTTVKLVWPSHLSEFYPRLSVMRQVDQVLVKGWDIQQKAPVVGQATSSGTKMGGTKTGKDLGNRFATAVECQTDRAVTTSAAAAQVAAATYNRLALTLIEAEGVCQGNPAVRAGAVIEIAGVGEHFSGLYYVTATTHRYHAQAGYQTRFTAQRNAL
ncbi:phage late control D family protein [Leptolyngbya sp. NK1-12]|uniref:Phage late control D family protein n=1 Tax=Leptolyngbya sp. NK1-12 TaxID=2547451 RepID=A0AA96WEL2_9CYAN|nr:phage late control D family protein [Leptolyngbya sp. NK1-12]